MKILGHPLHMMLIHFPAALFPMDLACSLIFFFGGPESLGHAAGFATLGGAGLGWLAILTGAADVIPIVRYKPALISKALIHGGINTVVVIGFSVFAMRYLKAYPAVDMDTVLVLGVKVGLVLLMFAGNFIGGSLVLKDGVGSQH